MPMKFNTVTEWLDWQTQLHSQAIDLGLDRISPVYTRLVQKSLASKIILVGGTNGKGSTVAFLEAIYTSGGYQVGTYTSPHMLSYNERIRLNGVPVSDDQLCQAFDHVEQVRDDVSLTYFEFGTFAAFDIFQNQSLDVVILEIGLGGCLDVVNLVDPDVSLITNVALDHMDWLGDTREQIAMEKIGISRSEKPLVFVDEDLPENAREYCSQHQVILYQLGKDFSYKQPEPQQKQNVWHWQSEEKKYLSLSPPALAGDHQLKNAAGALMVISLLENELPLSMPHLRLGLTAATLPGRFQVVPLLTQMSENLQIFDVAHNPHGIQAFLENLQKLPKIGIHYLVFGMLRDKALNEVIQLLKPHVDRWFLADIKENRGLSAAELKKTLIDQHISESDISCFESPVLAYEMARSKLQNHDKLLALGSFYVVADILNRAPDNSL